MNCRSLVIEGSIENEQQDELEDDGEELAVTTKEALDYVKQLQSVTIKHFPNLITFNFLC